MSLPGQALNASACAARSSRIRHALPGGLDVCVPVHEFPTATAEPWVASRIATCHVGSLSPTVRPAKLPRRRLANLLTTPLRRPFVGQCLHSRMHSKPYSIGHPDRCPAEVASNGWTDAAVREAIGLRWPASKAIRLGYLVSWIVDASIS